MYRKILVATDGTDLSAKAVETAVDLAALANAELLALTVVHHYPENYYEGGLTLNHERAREVEAEWRARAQKLVDAVRLQAEAKGVRCSALVISSNMVAEALINTARDQNCDLIVMASHGRRGLSRVLIGSETQHVLTHSHTPVLVLR